MARQFNRSDRIAEQVQRDLSEIIRRELKDPRMGMITITDVEVTRDLSYAKVFYTVMAGDKEETHATLSRSAGFLRSQLAKAITVFKIPALQFTYDDSVEHGMALDHLIDKAVTLHAADDETEE